MPRHMYIYLFPFDIILEIVFQHEHFLNHDYNNSTDIGEE